MDLLSDYEVFGYDGGSILLCIQDEIDLIRHIHLGGLRNDSRGLARGELTVHHGTRDTKPLRAACLPAAMESRPVQQSSEYIGNLFLDDSWPVVFYLREELVFVHFGQFHPNVGKDFGLFAGVKTIVEKNDTSSAKEFFAAGNTEVVDKGAGRLNPSD